MASELQWVPHYCLTCDKQTDGATYCSESCRLADYEETSSFSTYSSGPSSPSWSATYSRTSSSSRSRKQFSLAPAYDFSNPHPYGSTPAVGQQYLLASQFGHHGHYSHPYHYNSTSQHAAPRRSATSATALYSAATAAATTATSLATATPSLLPPTAATTTSVTYHHVLSPSSSHSSLSSMQSTLSSGGAAGALAAAFASGYAPGGFGTSAGSSNSDLSDRARSELRKYASSLEQGRLQRRRSC